MIKIIIFATLAITVYSDDLSDYSDLYELRPQLADYETRTSRPQSAEYDDTPRQSRPTEYVETRRYVSQRPQQTEYIDEPLVDERPTTASQQYRPVTAQAAQYPYYTAPLATPAYAAPTELVQPIAGPIGAAQVVKYFTEWAGVGANIKTNEAPVNSEAAFNVMNFANISILFAGRPAKPAPLPYYK